MSRNVFESGQITVRELPAIIQFAQRHNRSVLILGPMGVGKSRVMKQIADNMFGERDDNRLTCDCQIKILPTYLGYLSL